MYSEIKVINKEHTEFNLSRLRVKTKFKLIVFNCVYDNFSDSYDWMEEHNSEDTLVVFWHPVEVGHWDQSWIDRLNQKIKGKKFSFVYLTGAGPESNLNKFFNIDFDVKYFTAFDMRVVEMWNSTTGWENPPGPLDVMIHKYKHFTCLNRKDAVHRRYVLSRLYQSELLGNGVVSYQMADNGDVFLGDNDLNKNYGFTEAGIDYIKAQSKKTPPLPFYIEDHEPNNQSNFPIDVCCALYRNKHYNTYANLVGETFFTYPTNSFKQTFLTEKTFNAIACNQIFFIVGHPHSLRLLKQLGYKTFDSVIDESYDDVVSHQERLFTVTREAIKFLNRPEEEISNDYKKVIPIIEHNRDLLFKQTLKYKMQKFFDDHYNQQTTV